MNYPQTAKALATKWSHDTQLCSKCDISLICKHKVTHRLHTLSLSSRVEVMLIGEAPGESEYINKQPFVGPAGECLNTIIKEALKPTTSYIVTNAILCTPFKDFDRDSIRAPSNIEINACSSHIQSLVDAVRPKYFIALGRIAEKTCKLLKIPHYIYVLHPSRIMQSTKSDYEYDNAILNIQRYVYGTGN